VEAEAEGGRDAEAGQDRGRAVALVLVEARAEADVTDQREVAEAPADRGRERERRDVVEAVRLVAADEGEVDAVRLLAERVDLGGEGRRGRAGGADIARAGAQREPVDQPRLDDAVEGRAAAPGVVAALEEDERLLRVAARAQRERRERAAVGGRAGARRGL